MGNHFPKQSRESTRRPPQSLRIETNSESVSARRRSSVDSDVSPLYISSALTRPIGNTSVVTDSRPDSAHTSHKQTIPAEIVVVSEGGVDIEDTNSSLNFPPLFKPIIPIGHESLSLTYPQINPQIVTNIALIIEEQLKSKAEFVSKQQNKLIDRIKDVDVIVSHINSVFANERYRRLAKADDNFAKIDEIGALIEKCEIDIYKCTQNLDILNATLPQSVRLEPFEFSNTG